MVFSSLVFLCIFLPIVFLGHTILPGIRAKNAMLLLASLVFYAYGESVYVVLMVASALCNYLFALWIERFQDQKKWIVSVAVILNLALLVIFKYAGFLTESVNTMFGTGFPVPDIRLPIGISFFTFQAMSYVIDVYRGANKAQKNFGKVLLYISFFPQLIAGPIVKYHDVEQEIEHRTQSADGVAKGIRRFIAGLSKKVLISNVMGMTADALFGAAAGTLGAATAWVGALSYLFQIYFDFSGYSDMAIGLGRMFGFEFKKNFDVPYVSKSITEFWRRWHISLSSWFREYVYIPLGGNHVTISRNIVNLLIVWMLTGMWHGAAWNFIVWGIYYGVVLVLEKYVWGAIVDRWPSVLQHIYALVLVLVGWVFFFSPSLGAALRYLFAMVGGGAGFASKEVFFVILTHWLFYLLAVIGSTTIGSRLLRAILNVSENHTVRTVIMLIVFFGMLAISVAYLIADTYNPFLYFNF